MKISNKIYDYIKLVALIIAPLTVLVGSIGTALGQDWSVATGILAAIDVFVGSVVVILKKWYDETQGK